MLVIGNFDYQVFPLICISKCVVLFCYYFGKSPWLSCFNFTNA